MYFYNKSFFLLRISFKIFFKYICRNISLGSWKTFIDFFEIKQKMFCLFTNHDSLLFGESFLFFKNRFLNFLQYM